MSKANDEKEQTPEVQNSEVQNSEVQDSEVQDSEVHDSEVQNSEKRESGKFSEIQNMMNRQGSRVLVSLNAAVDAYQTRKPQVSEKTKNEYQQKINKHRDLTNNQFDRFTDERYRKTVVIRKSRMENLGVAVSKTGPHAVIPGIIVEKIFLNSPAHKTQKIRIGDQIVSINGTSVIGMPYRKTCELMKGVSKGAKVTLELIEAGNELISGSNNPESQSPNREIKSVYKNIDILSNPDSFLKVSIRKTTGHPMGMTLSPLLEDAAIPGIFISGITNGGPVWFGGQLQLGDQIIKINEQSTVGLSYKESIELASGCGQASIVDLEIVRTKKLTTHIISSNNHGIRLLKGRIFDLAPAGDAAKTGVKVGMYLMEIEHTGCYTESDMGKLKLLDQEGMKVILCMSTIGQNDAAATITATTSTVITTITATATATATTTETAIATETVATATVATATVATATEITTGMATGIATITTPTEEATKTSSTTTEVVELVEAVKEVEPVEAVEAEAEAASQTDI